MDRWYIVRPPGQMGAIDPDSGNLMIGLLELGLIKRLGEDQDVVFVFVTNSEYQEVVFVLYLLQKNNQYALEKI